MEYQQRKFSSGDIENCSSFLRIEVMDGKIYTDDWTRLVMMKMYLKYQRQKKDI